MTFYIGTASLSNVSTNSYLRCDVKQFDDRAKEIEKLKKAPFVFLGDFFTSPLVKGSQPNYLVKKEDNSIHVISTICIQKHQILESAYKYISYEDYDLLNNEKKLRNGDVLLTLDGGTSIGKSALFDKDIPCTVDSHVVIIRPEGIKPQHLVLLLASPVCQLQFNLFESGASGQTSVTEEDLRRFVIPKSLVNNLEQMAENLINELKRIKKERQQLDSDEEIAWKTFNSYA